MIGRENLQWLADDIQKKYTSYRRSGKDRIAAINLIREEYFQELQDEDDRLPILVGISLSLCKKKELFESIVTETLMEIQRTVSENIVEPSTLAYLMKIEQFLKDTSMYGNEAIYKKSSVYIPNWSNGDLFSHQLTCPAADMLKIRDYFILLYKVGDYTDNLGTIHQLVYVSICSPDNLPSCANDFQKLKWLCTMYTEDNSQHLAQITIKSKKYEQSLELSKIGHYPNILNLTHRIEENPLTAFPLFGRLKKEDLYPGYEEQICLLYKWQGVAPKKRS